MPCPMNSKHSLSVYRRPGPLPEARDTEINTSQVSPPSIHNILSNHRRKEPKAVEDKTDEVGKRILLGGGDVCTI